MNLIRTSSFELAIYAQGNKDSPKLALVLPGRLDSKDYTHMHSHVDFLASWGYFALSFDPPGTWESPGDISIYTMTNYLKAVNELIKHFGNKPTFVVGHSRGSSIAIISGCQNTNVFAIGILMGSSSFNQIPTLSDQAWKDRGYLLEKRDLPGCDPLVKIKEFKLPYSFYEDMENYDILSVLQNCPKPKLFIYGTKDITVKPEVVQKAYKLASSPKEIFTIDSDHNYRINSILIDKVNVLLGKFLDKYENC